MKPARDLIDMMRLHMGLPWGISCLYFALEDDGSAQAAGEFFARRRIPVLFFVSQAFSASTEARSMHGGAVRSLDEIRVMEGRN